MIPSRLHAVHRTLALWRADARAYQIACLAALTLYGCSCLGFDLQPAIAATLVATVLAAQWLGARLVAVRFEAQSALISGLSLCLLLRTNSVLCAILAGAVTIGSKFVLRWRGKHIFNPTNIGLVLILALAPQHAWIAAGQWGSGAMAAFAIACAGSLVIGRAQRSATTLAFLCTYAALLLARAAWLGDPLPLALHMLQNGTLLVFAFFMLSDPKTTPNSVPARLLFGSLVACSAAFVQFVLFRRNGFLWALAACAITVPLWDWLWPAAPYVWRRPLALRQQETP